MIQKLLIKPIFTSAIMLAALTATMAQSQVNPDSIRDKMQWFADAKLGIFIHWGIYSVDGVDESWSFYNKKISHDNYMDQLRGFTASNYNPDEWAELIKQSGARYAVITTKHHDGVALWPTKQDHYSVVKDTPAEQDLLTPFYAALDKQGIKRGAYFSLIDWSHPDYPAFIKDSSRYKISEEPKRWERFKKFYQAQIKEVNKAFKPDLWWFDGDWEHSAEEWNAIAVRENLLKVNPAAIINGRLQGYGDYVTPEQNFPVTRPSYSWWELCMTTNSNWGYQPQDNAWKTPYEIISIFADVIGYGGNLLLNISPKQDGTLPAQQVEILQTLGKWNKKNGEAVFNTLPGIPQGHFYGPTTLSKDSTTVYLFLPAKVNGSVMIKGLKSEIKTIRVLGTEEKLEPKIVGKISWSPVPGLVFIDIPPEVQDQYMTVLAVDLNEPVNLYTGQGGLH